MPFLVVSSFVNLLLMQTISGLYLGQISINIRIPSSMGFFFWGGGESNLNFSLTENMKFIQCCPTNPDKLSIDCRFLTLQRPFRITRQLPIEAVHCQWGGLTDRNISGPQVYWLQQESVLHTEGRKAKKYIVMIFLTENIKQNTENKIAWTSRLLH